MTLSLRRAARQHDLRQSIKGPGTTLHHRMLNVVFAPSRGGGRAEVKKRIPREWHPTQGTVSAPLRVSIVMVCHYSD